MIKKCRLQNSKQVQVKFSHQNQMIFIYNFL